MKLQIISLFLVLFGLGCSADKTETVAEKRATPIIQSTAKVQVYYFHGDRRCVTCQAVGAVAETTVSEKFGANPDVAFLEVNIDRAENEKLAEKFQVSGSGLYLLAHEKIEDLTAFAFQNARTAPEMLTNKLTELINQNLGI